MVIVMSSRTRINHSLFVALLFTHTDTGARNSLNARVDRCARINGIEHDLTYIGGADNACTVYILYYTRIL